MKHRQTKRSAPECHTKAISFKTKRGRVIKFMGRKGGADKCGKHPISSAQRSVRKAFAKVARSCNAKRKSLQKACWKGKGHVIGRKGFVPHPRALSKSAFEKRLKKLARAKTPKAQAKVMRSIRAANKRRSRSAGAIRVDTSICDSFKNPVRRKLCLDNLRKGRVLRPG